MKFRPIFLIIMLSFVSITPFMHGQNLDPQKNIVIVFDMDDVVIKANKNGVIFEHVIQPWKWQTISRVKKLKKDLGDEAAADQMIKEAQKRGWNDASKFLSKIARKKKPIKGTAAIIKELKAKKVPLYIGTNIGKKSFQSIINKKGAIGPLIKKNFNLQHPQTVDYEAATIIKKPNIEFFKQIIATNNLDLNKTNIIFIDDKATNIQSAQKAGMIGITFKNPKQLRIELKKLGIL